MFTAELTKPDGSLGIVYRDELDNLYHISNGAVRDQDFEVHPGIIALTSLTGRTRPASTSFKPRSNAASSAALSGSVFIANNSAVSRVLSRGLKFAIADLIS
jgi:hypothetical protein